MVNASASGVPPELREMIELAVEDAVDRRLQELLSDPDEGLELREEVVRRLKEQQKSMAAGDRGQSLDEVAKKLGLK
jgi:hypothetical protein